MESNSMVIYDNGSITIDVKINPKQETVYLSANQMARLFEKDEKTIRKHINNIFNSGELERENNT